MPCLKFTNEVKQLDKRMFTKYILWHVATKEFKSLCQAWYKTSKESLYSRTISQSHPIKLQSNQSTHHPHKHLKTIEDK